MSMNDFSVHRIIGRGGFGEVYGCRKADTGKMYAMKVCDRFFNLLNQESLANIQNKVCWLNSLK